MSNILRFTLRLPPDDVVPITIALQNKLNEFTWLGKAPGTCKFRKFDDTQWTSSQASVDIKCEIEYNPDGWRLKRIDKNPDGSLLDGRGNPLPEGHAPVILEWDIYHRIDFNQYNFEALAIDWKAEGF